MKNATPQQIAISTVGLIIALFTSGMILLKLTGFMDVSWLSMIVFLIISFIGTYTIVLFALKKYIYRKVKLIYKNIHRFKIASKEKSKDIDINSDIIGEVEEDVSKWIKDQRQEIENLKEMESYRRNFLGDISHELKTPIFNMQGYIYTLLDGGLYDKNINLNYLQKAANNIDRLQTIVNDLESISRLESGQLMLDIQPFDIKELAEEVIDDFEVSAIQYGIDLSFKDGASMNMLVKADRENIRKVFNNLIVNSLKYGKKEGRTKIAFYDMDKYVLVEVADNGVGIAEEHLNHLFDRFYRVDKSRSRTEGGSGLGLSIVKHIMEAHKQTINVRSSPDVGSTFGFTLAKG